MVKIYREGLPEFRAAVKKALEVGLTEKDITDGRWWTYGQTGRGVVATDAAIDAVIDCYSMTIVQCMKKGGMVRLQGFGTLYVGKRPARMSSGAIVNRPLPSAKVVRFKAAAALQRALEMGVGE